MRNDYEVIPLKRIRSRNTRYKINEFYLISTCLVRWYSIHLPDKVQDKLYRSFHFDERIRMLMMSGTKDFLLPEDRSGMLLQYLWSSSHTLTVDNLWSSFHTMTVDNMITIHVYIFSCVSRPYYRRLAPVHGTLSLKCCACFLRIHLRIVYTRFHNRCIDYYIILHL